MFSNCVDLLLCMKILFTNTVSLPDVNSPFVQSANILFMKYANDSDLRKFYLAK